MHTFFASLFFCFSLSVWANEFTIFEKNGYFGLKDETGNITIPPIYEKLGWSDGSNKIIDEVLGFQQDNLWGLISVKNKFILKQKFYSITPIQATYFRASIKGDFSNQLFYGIINTKGETIISFNYLSIEDFSPNWLVSKFDGERQLFGVVSLEHDLIIPLQYLAIQKNRELILAQQDNKTFNLFTLYGQKLQTAIDSLIYTNGWIIYKKGNVGFLLPNGEELHPLKYKSIQIKDGNIVPKLFPEWKIYKGDSIIMKLACDSMKFIQNKLLIAFLNESHHFYINQIPFFENQDWILKKIWDTHIILKNNKTNLWSVFNEKGIQLITEYDSIISNGTNYLAQKKEGWKILSRSGKIKNRSFYQQLHEGVNGQTIAQKGQYWGILSAAIKLQTPCKYDSIIKTNDAYIVSYLNFWGIMNTEGKWLFRPQFDRIYALGNILVGQKGHAYTVFYKGIKKSFTTNKPVTSLNKFILIVNENGKYGLLNEYGDVIIYPKYNRIKMVGNFFALSQNGVELLVSKQGNVIINAKKGYQTFKSYNERFLLAKKGNKWGFIDEKGRLRISNRYDSAKAYKEGFAAIMLRGKWGFIDKFENLIVQPYYSTVSDFEKKRAIVQLDGKYGLIDATGKEILKPTWKHIAKLATGNYRVINTANQIGLLNSQGIFILRPAYQQLIDVENKTLVSNGNLWGILNHAGKQIFNMVYKDIKIFEEYTLIKN